MMYEVQKGYWNFKIHVILQLFFPYFLVKKHPNAMRKLFEKLWDFNLKKTHSYSKSVFFLM